MRFPQGRAGSQNGSFGKNSKVCCNRPQPCPKISEEEAWIGRPPAKEAGPEPPEGVEGCVNFGFDLTGPTAAARRSLPGSNDAERSDRRDLWRARNVAVSGGCPAPQAPAAAQGTTNPPSQAARPRGVAEDARLLTGTFIAFEGTHRCVRAHDSVGSRGSGPSACRALPAGPASARWPVRAAAHSALLVRGPEPDVHFASPLSHSRHGGLRQPWHRSFDFRQG